MAFATAGGIAFEFPIHPIQETCKRPTAMLDRNLQYLSLVEILLRIPDRRRRLDHWLRQDYANAQLMAAATVDITGDRLVGWPND